MTFRVTILPQAQSDIDRNADWWADRHSVEQAIRWSDAIYDQLETLREFPERHPLAAENDEFPYEIREKLVGLGSRLGYRAVFTTKDDVVFVLTLRAAEEDRLKSTDVDYSVDRECAETCIGCIDQSQFASERRSWISF